jgi:ketosteroid isomerase-like protein
MGLMKWMGLMHPTATADLCAADLIIGDTVLSAAPIAVRPRCGSAGYDRQPAGVTTESQTFFSPIRWSQAMPSDITNDLPPAIARHLAACNGHDIDAWMATFAPDALVNDVQREFVGAEAIRAFATKEIFGDRVTFTPLRAIDRHGDITVHARTDGTYDKTGLPDPLILSLYFSLREERITQLIIIHNRALA